MVDPRCLGCTVVVTTVFPIANSGDGESGELLGDGEIRTVAVLLGDGDTPIVAESLGDGDTPTVALLLGDGDAPADDGNISSPTRFGHFSRRDGLRTPRLIA